MFLVNSVLFTVYFKNKVDGCLYPYLNFKSCRKISGSLLIKILVFILSKKKLKLWFAPALKSQKLSVN